MLLGSRQHADERVDDDHSSIALESRHEMEVDVSHVHVHVYSTLRVLGVWLTHSNDCMLPSHAADAGCGVHGAAIGW